MINKCTPIEAIAFNQNRIRKMINCGIKCLNREFRKHIQLQFVHLSNRKNTHAEDITHSIGMITKHAHSFVEPFDSLSDVMV